MNKTNHPRRHKPQIRQFTVGEEIELLSYLFKQFPEKSKNNRKIHIEQPTGQRERPSYDTIQRAVKTGGLYFHKHGKRKR